MANTAAIMGGRPAPGKFRAKTVSLSFRRLLLTVGFRASPLPRRFGTLFPLPVRGFPSALSEGKTQQTLQEGEKMAPGKLNLRETRRIETLRISLVKERSALSYTLSTPLQAAQAAQQLVGTDLDRETFGILLLDTRHRVTALHIVSAGSLNGSIFHPREVFKAAILGNAGALILFHNHPSGDLRPSAEDRAITRRLMEAGKLLGISVLDHLILGDRGAYASFQEEGWI